MSAFWALCRRQLAAYFYAPLAYAVLTVFLAVAGLSFCRLITQSLEENLNASDLLFGSMYFWFMVLVAITLISMPLFAEEKRSGTLESLLTAPVTDLQVVMAKFSAAFLFFFSMTLPLLAYVALLPLCSTSLSGLYLLPVITGYLLLLLMGAFFIAFGLWISALTRSQVVAAILSFTGLSLFFFVDSLQYLGGGRSWALTLDYISSVQHMVDFGQGIVDTRPLVLYLSGVAFFLFAAVKAIESRQWR